MNSRYAVKTLGTALTFFTIVFVTHSQPSRQVPYYINLNEADGRNFHEISDHTLNITYHDRYGKWKEALLKMYNWKREIVATMRLDKSYGLNTYTIKLDDIYNGWEVDELYQAEFRDESGRLHLLPIRIVAPPDKEDPFVDIFTNPIHVSCNGLEENIVEFYGNVQGGKPPYLVNWYVLNSTRTDFLYQPKEESLRNAGKISRITVGVRPEYYVVLFVKDACGNTQKKVVNLICDDGSKKVNTIFLEELASPLFTQKKSVK